MQKNTLARERIEIQKGKKKRDRTLRNANKENEITAKERSVNKCEEASHFSKRFSHIAIFDEDFVRETHLMKLLNF